MYVQPERKPPIRDENFSVRDDLQYWWSIYHNDYAIVHDWADRHVQVKPDFSLKLMAELAPDFPYDAKLSTPSRLVFLQAGASQVAWALIIEKAGGAVEYRYPPRLILCMRGHGKRLKEKDVLFNNVIEKDSFYGRSDSPRGRGRTAFSPAEMQAADRILYAVSPESSLLILSKSRGSGGKAIGLDSAGPTVLSVTRPFLPQGAPGQYVSRPRPIARAENRCG
jgi:hypothetical protein